MGKLRALYFNTKHKLKQFKTEDLLLVKAKGFSHHMEGEMSKLFQVFSGSCRRKLEQSLIFWRIRTMEI